MSRRASAKPPVIRSSVDEGNLDKAEGKIQKGAGDIKDKI